MDIEPDFSQRLSRSVELRLDLLESEHPGESFEALRALPDLYRLLWRLAFDMHLAPVPRHYAASLAFYVFSRLDYLPEDSPGAMGYLDDLAVAVHGIRAIRADVGEGRIAEHWRARDPLDAALAGADAILAEHLPDRVGERVEAYLRR